MHLHDVNKDNLDHRILGTGKVNLLSLFSEIKKLKILMIPNRKNYSALFRKFRKDIIYMNDLREKLKYKKDGEYPKDRTLSVPHHHN